jgi:hypothetical protein
MKRSPDGQTTRTNARVAQSDITDTLVGVWTGFGIDMGIYYHIPINLPLLSPMRS